MLYFLLRTDILKSMMYIRFLAISFFVLFNFPANAQKTDFILPVDCTLGEDCWVANYVDVNPKEGLAEDLRCNNKTYDGHKGTDFALRSRGEMQEGVNVLAARAGTVERLRDGESDSIKNPEELEQIKELQKECGNGIFIDHGAAIKTVYCHLKKDSIKVAAGDKVEVGDIIGQVGQSGLAEFPHLHFGILWENSVIDPYTGLTNLDGCGSHKGSLWKNSDSMLYTPVSIYDGGFRANAPDFKAIEEGQDNPDFISAESPAFVFWSAFYGVREGDIITMSIADKQGRLFVSRDIEQPKTRTRQYYYTGRSLKGKTLPTGLYKGLVTLEREGIAKRTKEFDIEIR